MTIAKKTFRAQATPQKQELKDLHFRKSRVLEQESYTNIDEEAFEKAYQRRMRKAEKRVKAQV